MSLYRRLIVAVAALGLATSVFAADETTTTTSTSTDNNGTAATAPAPADTTASPTAAAEPEKTGTETTTTTTTASSDKVDINKATVRELMKLKGLNAAKAKAIVTYRKKHGDFKSLDDLKEVKGFKKINDKKLQTIEDQLTVG